MATLTLHRAVGIAVAVVYALAWVGPTAAAPIVLASKVADAVAERAVFGLDTDPALVTSLLASSQDIGSRTFGIPATQAELDTINLLERAAIASRAESEFLPAAAVLPGFAGLFQDQARGGRIVIRFTSMTTEAKASLAAVATGAPIEIVEGAAVTFVQLEEALLAAWATFPSVVPGGRLITVAIDETSSSLRLGVSADTMPQVRDRLVDLQQRLGVPVALEVRAEPALESCNGRNACYDPMKAGSKVRNQGASVWQECTMGFHVYVGTSFGFTMTGHCSYAGQSDNWYMDGWPAPSGGYIGAVTKTLYKDLGQDFMVVRLPAAQRSDLIYAQTRRVQGRGNPITGETICASLGETNAIDCGTVRTASLSWEDGNSIISRGADHDGISTQVGDSGSPLWRLSGTSYAVATGLHVAHEGWFTKMADAVIAAGVRMYP